MMLKEKVVIITGGSRGIGKVMAERFALEGFRLMLVARTKSELLRTAKFIRKEYGAEVEICPIDVGYKHEVEYMVQETIDRFGQIDILINNAGIIGPMGEISTVDAKEFFDTIRINLGGMVFCTQEVIPYMKRQTRGCIINLSGGGGLHPFPYYDAYSASKAAIVRLTENLAVELAEFNIRVTGIAPGAVNTKMFKEQLKVDESIIGSRNWRALQKRLETGGDPIEKAADLAIFIVDKGWFNGRIISANWDDWENI